MLIRTPIGSLTGDPRGSARRASGSRSPFASRVLLGRVGDIEVVGALVLEAREGALDLRDADLLGATDRLAANLDGVFDARGARLGDRGDQLAGAAGGERTIGLHGGWFFRQGVSVGAAARA